MKRKLFTLIAITYSTLILGQISTTEFKKFIISDDIELIKLSENAYMHISYVNQPKYGKVGSNALIFINNNKAFLFDSPWDNEQTKKLISWLNDSLNIEIIGFIPNHWHDDCMGGPELLQHSKLLLIK